MEFMGMTVGPASSPDLWACSDFQAAEDRTLRAFNAINGDTRFQSPTACARLEGFEVYLHPAPVFYDSFSSVPLAGLTDCERRGTVVAKSTPGSGALSHEMAHMIQGCSPLDHSNWTELGIFTALEKARGEN